MLRSDDFQNEYTGFIDHVSLKYKLDMSYYGRVVKATDLKSVGIFPHRFKSCW